MAPRIRTIKPELWTNEKVCAVSIPAVLTFIGLISNADDDGRHRDKPRTLHGLIWPERDDMTWQQVAGHLDELAAVGLICRHVGCDGKAYLHLVGWYEHQKISHPAASRLAACPTHNSDRACGRCDKPHVMVGAVTSLVPAQVGIAPRQAAETARPHPEGTGVLDHLQTAPVGKIPAQRTSPETLQRTPEDLLPGSRILDPGSFPVGGGSASAPRGNSAREMVAWYTSSCRVTPSRQVRGHLGRVIQDLLDEGTAPAHIHAGLRLFRAKNPHPSVLPSMVNEAVNTCPAPTRGREPHRGWTNPASAEAYAGVL